MVVEEVEVLDGEDVPVMRNYFKASKTLERRVLVHPLGLFALPLCM